MPMTVELVISFVKRVHLGWFCFTDLATLNPSAVHFQRKKVQKLSLRLNPTDIYDFGTYMYTLGTSMNL